jgi:hypothetical protein
MFIFSCAYLLYNLLWWNICSFWPFYYLLIFYYYYYWTWNTSPLTGKCFINVYLSLWFSCSFLSVLLYIHTKKCMFYVRAYLVFYQMSWEIANHFSLFILVTFQVLSSHRCLTAALLGIPDIRLFFFLSLQKVLLGSGWCPRVYLYAC